MHNEAIRRDSLTLAITQELRAIHSRNSILHLGGGEKAELNLFSVTPQGKFSAAWGQRIMVQKRRTPNDDDGLRSLAITLISRIIPGTLFVDALLSSAMIFDGDEQRNGQSAPNVSSSGPCHCCCEHDQARTSNRPISLGT